ncbi:MAG: hypothetical protein M3Q46_03550 [Verrucomicrobiota bacterium]|nr:hypothetical protein [Verrucomicrobiota bacterium]
MPGYFGEKNVKWVARTEVALDGAKGFYEQQGWDPDFIVPHRFPGRPDATAAGPPAEWRVEVTFKKGTGDSADDFYVVYLDPKTKQLKLVNYLVTFAALRKGRPLDQLEPHALVFEEWQGRGRVARAEARLLLQMEG